MDVVITDERKRLKDFRDVNPGQIFFFENKPFIKVFWTIDNLTRPFSNASIPKMKHHAVELRTGMLHALSKDEPVELIEGRFNGRVS